ncbi:Signal transduction histidine kinase [Dyadobacter sp. SG02]|nr:Signal transduction histidine kinase [Dyadobacter sp. SG02]
MVSSADISRFNVRHYTNDNGLPQNSVKDVAMDKEGFIWLATEAGLVRFDGRTFKVFDKADLGTPTSRFFRFHLSMTPSDEKLMVVLDQDNFVRLGKGNAYTDQGYHTAELGRIPTFTKGIRHTTLASGLPNGSEKVLFPMQYIVPLHPGTGRYYLCDSGRIEYFDQWKKRSAVKVSGLSFWDMFPLDSTLFARDNAGRFVRIEPDSRTADTHVRILGDMLLDHTYRKSPGLARIYWNAGSGQVFFYLQKKLYAVEATREGDLHTRLILSGFDFDDHEIIRIFYETGHQRIFLGSPSQGLFVLSRTSFRSVVTARKGIPNAFYAQTPLTSSSLLLPEGLIADIRDDRAAFTGKAAFISGLNLYQRNLLISRDKSIWGRFHDLVYRLSPDGKQIIDQWHFPGEVEVLYEHTDGRIWVGNGDGLLFLLDPKLPSIPPELVMKGLRGLHYLLRKGDQFWAGTDKGVYQLWPDRKKAMLIAGTGNFIIRSLHISNDNHLWFTTYENGFYLYKDNKLTQFPLDKARGLAIPHCIIEDRNGFFWISTNNGLFQILKSDLLRFAQDSSHAPYYHFYSKENGFATNEFNGGCQPCGVTMDNGFVSLPSILGLVVFRPQDVKPEIPSRGIFIDGVRAGGNAWPFSSDTVRLEASPPVVEIEVTTPYFASPHNLTFEYALAEEGRTTPKWLQVDDGQRILLSNLKSGSYILLVRKNNGFDGLPMTVRKLVVKVEKNWYETWYAKTAAILLAAFLFWLYGRFQSRRLEKRNRNLETLIEKRTENLIQTLEALQESENQLTRQVQIQTRMIASLTHDIKSPLQAIITVSKGIGNLLNMGKISQVAELSNAITDSTVRVSNLLENTLDYIKLQISERSHPLERFDLHMLVAQKTDLFAMAARKNQNRFMNAIPLNLMVSGNAYLFGIIINNIIDNANKHTKQGVIKIECDLEKPRLTLTISDTGTGMPAGILNWLNAQVDSRMEYASLENMHGVGLLLVKEFTRVAGGELRAENDQNGFRIYISIPGQWEFSNIKSEFQTK